MTQNYASKAKALGLTNAPSVNAPQADPIAVERLVAEKISDLQISLTVDKAVEYIGLPVFLAEREVSEAHVNTLVDEIRRGRFNWDNVVVATCVLGSATYKVNGQHTMWARLELPTDKSPTVREIKYRVKTEAQLKALYSSFDRAKPRSDVHLTKIELVGSAAGAGLRQSTISTLSAAVRFWLYPKTEDYRRISPAELAALIHTQHGQVFNTVGLFLDSLDDDSYRFLKKQPVLAAMVDNFSKVPTVAPSFWRDIAQGTNLDKDYAQWHLRRYLETSALHRSGANSTKKVVASEEVYRVCIGAWNRWRKNEKVDMLKTTKNRMKSL